jgi:hypothetical protein
MSNMKTIKLIERPANDALDMLTSGQVVHIDELALERS